MYREMGMTYWLEKAEAEMGELGWNVLAARPRIRPASRARWSYGLPRSGGGAQDPRSRARADDEGGPPLRRHGKSRASCSRRTNTRTI